MVQELGGCPQVAAVDRFEGVLAYVNGSVLHKWTLDLTLYSFLYSEEMYSLLSLLLLEALSLLWKYWQCSVGKGISCVQGYRTNAWKG